MANIIFTSPFTDMPQFVIPSAAALTHVNQNETQTGDNKKSKEAESMSDFNDVSYKLGQIEANIEHQKAGQARIEASIASLAENMNGIISKIEKKIDDKFEIIDSTLEKKITEAELKNVKWSIGIAFTIISILLGFGYFAYNQIDKKQPNSDIITSIDKTNTLLESLLENKQNIAPIIPKQKEQSKP
jgi:hypothetical protein